MKHIERVLRDRGWRSTRSVAFVVLALAGLLLTGCGEPLPDAVKGYRTRCIQMNAEPLPVTPDDPHEGVKDVFACNVTLDQLRDPATGVPTTNYPDGTLIVKESTRDGQPYPWLVATMEKKAGTWEWHEYTRNFDDEDFAEIPVKDTVCIDCHKKVEAIDWVYTRYEAPSE